MICMYVRCMRASLAAGGIQINTLDNIHEIHDKMIRQEMMATTGLKLSVRSK